MKKTLKDIEIEQLVEDIQSLSQEELVNRIQENPNLIPIFTSIFEQLNKKDSGLKN